MHTTAPSYLSSLTAPGPALLRLSLRLDAVITTVNGLAYLALAGPLESLLGLDTSLAIPIGIFLTLYGLAVAIIGTRPAINPTATRIVIAANTAWVLFSLATVFVTDTLDLNLIGSTWAVIQAGTVGGFAALQYLGLRKTQ
ncbi:hypothetical protein [Nocardia brasiliensis]|uniref:hypothetical protein n=1 Tax=Nocardia brasiliensis TaxID=37326 RepID=UPI0036718EBE